MLDRGKARFLEYSKSQTAPVLRFISVPSSAVVGVFTSIIGVSHGIGSRENSYMVTVQPCLR